MTQQGALGPNCKKGGQVCDPCCGSTGRLDEPVVKRATAGRGGRERRPLEGPAPGDRTAGT